MPDQDNGLAADFLDQPGDYFRVAVNRGDLVSGRRIAIAGQIDGEAAVALAQIGQQGFQDILKKESCNLALVSRVLALPET